MLGKIPSLRGIKISDLYRGLKPTKDDFNITTMADYDYYTFPHEEGDDYKKILGSEGKVGQILGWDEEGKMAWVPSNDETDDPMPIKKDGNVIIDGSLLSKTKVAIIPTYIDYEAMMYVEERYWNDIFMNARLRVKIERSGNKRNVFVIKDDGKDRQYGASRVVWNLMHPEDPVGNNETIIHLDSNSLNDCPENLAKR